MSLEKIELGPHMVSAGYLLNFCELRFMDEKLTRELHCGFEASLHAILHDACGRIRDKRAAWYEEYGFIPENEMLLAIVGYVGNEFVVPLVNVEDRLRSRTVRSMVHDHVERLWILPNKHREEMASWGYHGTSLVKVVSFEVFYNGFCLDRTDAYMKYANKIIGNAS